MTTVSQSDLDDLKIKYVQAFDKLIEDEIKAVKNDAFLRPNDKDVIVAELTTIQQKRKIVNVTSGTGRFLRSTLIKPVLEVFAKHRLRKPMQELEEIHSRWENRSQMLQAQAHAHAQAHTQVPVQAQAQANAQTQSQHHSQTQYPLLNVTTASVNSSMTSFCSTYTHAGYQAVPSLESLSPPAHNPPFSHSESNINASGTYVPNRTHSSWLQQPGSDNRHLAIPGLNPVPDQSAGSSRGENILDLTLIQLVAQSNVQANRQPQGRPPARRRDQYEETRVSDDSDRPFVKELSPYRGGHRVVPVTESER